MDKQIICSYCNSTNVYLDTNYYHEVHGYWCDDCKSYFTASFIDWSKTWKDTTDGEWAVDCIEDMPKNVIGFVYCINFTDGTKYIGKKNLYITRTLKALKNGKRRIEALKTIYQNTGKGKREVFDIIQKESNWKTYQGSAKECKTKTVKERLILCYAFNKYQLTYLETKYLMVWDVLEDDTFINDNILGKFYKCDLLTQKE